MAFVVPYSVLLVAGLSSPVCSGNCSAGAACPAGSVNDTAEMCPAGQFSLSGSGTCTLCDAGAYGDVPGVCAGPCPGGRYGATAGLGSAACSGNCSAGYACPVGSANGTAVPCAPNSFSTTGSAACKVRWVCLLCVNRCGDLCCVLVWELSKKEAA